MFISPTASRGSPNHNHDSNIVSEFLYLQFLNIVYDWINEQCPYFLFLWYPLGSVPNSYMMILITSNLIISQLLPSFDGFTLHFTIVMGPHGEILLNNQLSLQIEFTICTWFFFAMHPSCLIYEKISFKIIKLGFNYVTYKSLNIITFLMLNDLIIFCS